MLDRFPPEGLGVGGPSPPNRLAVLAPSWLWLADPNEERRPPLGDPLMVFSSGLTATGENVELLSLMADAGLPLPESGELA